MSGGQPAEEVAEDYKASLEYLTNNDRYAINNFTVIAKENTENADAISNVLIEHIGKVSANADSIPHPHHHFFLNLFSVIADSQPITPFLGSSRP